MSTEQGNVQPWREAEVLIRESLLDGTVGGDLSEVRYNRAIMALTALTAQIEELEESVKTIIREDGVVVSRQRAQIEELERKKWGTFAEDYDEVFARAEKAERALAETRQNVEQALDELEAAGSDPAPLRVVRFALRPSEDNSDES